MFERRLARDASEGTPTGGLSFDSQLSPSYRLQAVRAGARLAIEECQHQFRSARWNCSVSPENPENVFGGVMLVSKYSRFDCLTRHDRAGCVAPSELLPRLRSLRRLPWWTLVRCATRGREERRGKKRESVCVLQIAERPRSYTPYQQPGSLTASRGPAPEASSPIAPATIA